MTKMVSDWCPPDSRKAACIACLRSLQIYRFLRIMPPIPIRKKAPLNVNWSVDSPQQRTDG